MTLYWPYCTYYTGNSNSLADHINNRHGHQQ